MKLIIAFLRLIRSQNLFFIGLTQGLFYYCIFPFAFKSNYTPGIQILAPSYFWLLCGASILIAGAGYIINDYFDLNIDLINKPGKLVVEKIIKRRWAIVWHWVLSFLGVFLSFYVSWKVNNWFIGFANLAAVFLLVLYSTSFKKKLLIGNVIISLLTAWVIMVLFVTEWKLYATNRSTDQRAISTLFKLAVVYAGFAFVISLIREVIKDVEDMDGDARYNAKTMPIVWGINVSKTFTAVWLVVLIAVLVILQFYVLQFMWWWSVTYTVFLVIVPLVFVLRKLYYATSKKDYRQLSRAVKFVMLMGIASMVFFKWHL